MTKTLYENLPTDCSYNIRKKLRKLESYICIICASLNSSFVPLMLNMIWKKNYKGEKNFQEKFLFWSANWREMNTNHIANSISSNSISTQIPIFV